MIDPVAARPAGARAAELYSAAEAGLQGPASQGPGALSPQDQALFEQRMSAPRAGETITVEIRQPAVEPKEWVLPGPPKPPGVLSVGERILQGMNSFQESWAGAVGSIETLATRTDIQPTEMISIQFQIGYSSMMLATVSQEVGSISQKIDGLLKTG